MKLHKESPEEWGARQRFRQEVLAKGRCFFRGIIAHQCVENGEALDPMHFLPAQRLEMIARRRGMDDTDRINMKFDSDNGAPGCRTMHSRLDLKHVRLYQSQLPDSFFDFVDLWELHDQVADFYPEGEPPHE